MIKTKNDLTGKKFGRLTVICQVDDKIYDNGRKRDCWRCICDCGNSTIADGGSLKKGHKKSCGCLNYEHIAKVNAKREKENIYELSEEIGICYNKDKTWCCYFDVDDYELIKPYRWYMNNTGYIVSRKGKSFVFMHRLIMMADTKQLVDHINHLPFDNRRVNLRICNETENRRNCKRSDSNINGVSLVKKTGNWRARIVVDGKEICLGTYSNKEDAIKARIDAENKFFKDFGLYNSMKQATYPQNAKKIYVREKYRRYLAILSIALASSGDKAIIYGTLPMLIETLNDGLNVLEDKINDDK
jgi:hypothetical protein